MDYGVSLVLDSEAGYLSLIPGRLYGFVESMLYERREGTSQFYNEGITVIIDTVH